MIRLVFAALVAVFLFQSNALAADRIRLGYGRLVNNDQIGDGRDRWRTGSVASSRVWGRDWTGQPPKQMGDLIELRFNAQIIAPSSLGNPSAGDRPYAGVLSLGGHTHFQQRGTEFSLGGDLVMTGPQTGLDDFQKFIHDITGNQTVGARTRNTQIGNDITPMVVVEVGRPLTLGNTGQLRPFAEGQLGTETLLRFGADFSLGSVGQGELLIRDQVTGQRYRVVRNELPGFSYVMGGDIAYVSQSEFLPSNRGYQLSDYRSRLRAGLHWQSAKGHHAFYGLTWLGKEFKNQPEGQILGSVRLHISF